MIYALFAFGALASIIVVFLVSGNARAKWTSDVAKELFRLNVVVPDLAEFPTNRFNSSAFNEYSASKGAFPPAAFACDFFAWYLTEFPGAKLSSLVHEHPLHASLESLASLAQSEDTKIQSAAIAAHNAIVAWVAVQGALLERVGKAESSPERGGGAPEA